MTTPAPRRPYETGLARARRRRRRRSAAVITVATLLVALGFGYALAYWQRWLPGQAVAEPSCATAVQSTPPIAAFRLNVYNSGGKQGGANNVALAMRSQGFTIGVIGNDPYRKKLEGIGEIRYGAAGEQDAERFVRPLAPDAQMVQDGRTDTSVDIAVGTQFPTIPTKSPPPTPTSTC